MRRKLDDLLVTVLMAVAALALLVAIIMGGRR